jgi:hypothetical protein
MKKVETVVMPTAEQLLKASGHWEEYQALQAAAKGSYRKLALQHYGRIAEGGVFHLCVVCGFGVAPVLEVAHLDQDRKNNAVGNLALLCPNCHKMHDIGLLPTAVVRELRDSHLSVDWMPRIKDAGKKAATTRKAKAVKTAKSVSAKKAWATRQKKAA